MADPYSVDEPFFDPLTPGDAVYGWPDASKAFERMKPGDIVTIAAELKENPPSRFTVAEVADDEGFTAIRLVAIDDLTG